jgi:glycine/D-amino acid oxidase-like deaminating enzyme
VRVAVVGAGAVGTTVAAALATAGESVHLFERGDGGGATKRAAGICYAAFSEEVDAALGLRSLERFRASAATFHECPYVVVVREGDEANAGALGGGVERMQAHGVTISMVGPGGLPPGVAAGDVAAAAVTTDAGWVDPAEYATVTAERAQAAGARLRTGVEASVRVDPPGVAIGGRDEPFDAVVVAAGAHTRRLLAGAGVRVPVAPYRVQALLAAGRYDGPMVFDATTETYLRPDPRGLVAGDGADPVAADPDAWDRTGDPGVERAVAADVAHRVDADVTVQRSWAGLCTATPDGDPVVGEVRPGVYVAAGWQGHGFMRAPAVGVALATAVRSDRGSDAAETDDEPAVPAAFDPGRFDGDEPVRVAGTVIGPGDPNDPVPADDGGSS